MSSDSEPLETSLKQNRDAIKVVQPLPRVVPIKYLMEDAELIYSDLGMVQYAPNGMVVLSFFQSEVPFFERPEEILGLDSIPAHCVARIVVPSEQFKLLLKLYQDTLARQQETLQERQESHK